MARLEIVIKQVGANGADSPLPIPTNPVMPQSTTPLMPKEEMSNSKGLKYGLGIASMVAQQTISYATSNVGKWSGNSKNQEVVNLVNNALSVGTAFLVNPYLGVASLAVQATTAFVDYKFEKRQDEQKANFQRNISGYTYGESIFSKRRH